MLLVGGRGLVLSVEEVLRSRLGERPVKGGTDGRRGSAGCVVDLRVRTRSAGEGSRPRKESGPGVTTPTVVGEGLTGHNREVATFLSLGFV